MADLNALTEKLHWLGHSGFRLDLPEATVYLDPYQLDGDAPPADLVLCTHSHFDHFAKDDLARIITSQTLIILGGQDVQAFPQTRSMGPGENTAFRGINIRTLPAYNLETMFHPKEKNWVGFYLEYKGVSLYHTGDADFIPEMRDLHPDIALLPVSGTYVMTARQAQEAALALRPALAVPMHYGAIVGHKEDAGHFAELLAGQVPVKIMRQESRHLTL